MKTYQIHFVRHGLTKENFNGQYIGSTDVPLSDDGVNKLKELSNKFTYPRADKVYSSPLKRCKTTCEILYPEEKAIIFSGLAECNFGEWEGKTAVELKDNSKFREWLSNSESAAPEGGESLKEFSDRILTSFEELVNKVIKDGYKDTVVVTHGGVIMAIMAAFGVPRAKLYDWVVNNGCGYSVRITPSLWARQRVFEVYSKVPYDMTNEDDSESAYILDLVREASNRAYGTED